MKPKLGKEIFIKIENYLVEEIDRNPIAKITADYSGNLYRSKNIPPLISQENLSWKIINGNSEDLPEISTEETEKVITHMKRNKTPSEQKYLQKVATKL